jgi:hypothetical protein
MGKSPILENFATKKERNEESNGNGFKKNHFFLQKNSFFLSK